MLSFTGDGILAQGTRYILNSKLFDALHSKLFQVLC